MKDRSFQIKLNNPCSQDWDAMPQVAGGLYCNQCSKVVTDFTAMSDEELIRVLSRKNTGETCGKFYESQLNKAYLLQTTGPQRSFHSIKLLLAGLLTLRLPAEAQTQRLHEPVTVKAQQKKPAGEPQTHVKCIKGKITDARTRSGISAFINIYADKEGNNLLSSVGADDNGNYTVQLPDTGLNKFFRLTYFSGSYSERHITVDRDNAPAYLPVSLLAPAEDLQGVMAPVFTTGGVPMIDYNSYLVSAIETSSGGTYEQVQKTEVVKTSFFKRAWIRVKRVFKKSSHKPGE